MRFPGLVLDQVLFEASLSVGLNDQTATKEGDFLLLWSVCPSVEGASILDIALIFGTAARLLLVYFLFSSLSPPFVPLISLPAFSALPSFPPCSDGFLEPAPGCSLYSKAYFPVYESNLVEVQAVEDFRAEADG